MYRTKTPIPMKLKVTEKQQSMRRNVREREKSSETDT